MYKFSVKTVRCPVLFFVVEGGTWEIVDLRFLVRCTKCVSFGALSPAIPLPESIHVFNELVLNLDICLHLLLLNKFVIYIIWLWFALLEYFEILEVIVVFGLR